MSCFGLNISICINTVTPVVVATQFLAGESINDSYICNWDCVFIQLCVHLLLWKDLWSMMTQNSTCCKADNIPCCLFIIYYLWSNIQSFELSLYNNWNGIWDAVMQRESNKVRQRNRICMGIFTHFTQAWFIWVIRVMYLCTRRRVFVEIHIPFYILKLK